MTQQQTQQAQEPRQQEAAGRSRAQLRELASSPEREQSAWDSFRYWTGSDDRETYQASYLGNWISRSAFGDSLLEEFGASERLGRLPHWLQRYITVVPERIVEDFENAGYYFVAEGASGVYVFDRQVSGFQMPVAGLPDVIHNEEQ